MKFRSLLSSIRRVTGGVLLSVLIPANYGAYKTLWRDHHSTPVPVHYDSNILEVIKSAPGDNLEDKVKEAIYEKILFDEVKASEKFQGQMFEYLKINGYDIKGKNLTLDEKINMAQMFSSTLEYNDKANFIDYIYQNKSVKKDKNGPSTTKLVFDSIHEFIKINLMSAEEIVDYHDVVCGQYSDVFSAALNTINKSSANPEKISVGRLYYVPNYDYNYGQPYDFILSASNAIGFGEWRRSVGHAKNIIVTDSSFYLIDPQAKVNSSLPSAPVEFDFTVLDIDSKYSEKIK